MNKSACSSMLGFSFTAIAAIVTFAVVFDCVPALIGIAGVFFVLMMFNRLSRKGKR